MAQATDLPTTSRFQNLSSGALADALGRADAALKGAEAECKGQGRDQAARTARGPFAFEIWWCPKPRPQSARIPRFPFPSRSTA